MRCVLQSSLTPLAPLGGTQNALDWFGNRPYTGPPNQPGVAMNVRSPSPLRGLLLAVLLTGTASLLPAQQAPLRSGQSPGPKFIVPTLRSDADRLGFQVANAVRQRIASDFDMRALWVVPESTITDYLRRAGYPVDQPLSPSETRMLATAFRAEEYINGSVSRTPAGTFRIQADWALGARTDMVQPLPVIEAAKIGDLAKLVSNEFQAARRQMEAVRRCMDLARAKRYGAALAEARKAIAAYPRSVFGRVCIANIYAEEQLGPDSMIRISREILEIHPENQRALAFAADAYSTIGATENAITALTKLHDLDPRNGRVTVSLAGALARTGRYGDARTRVDAALDANSEDATLLELRWRICLAMKDWACALETGERRLAADSGAATPDLFLGMVGAASASGDTAKAIDLAGRGAARFATHDELPLVHAQLLRATGQLQQALEVIDRLAARNPRVPNVWVQKARVEADLGRPTDTVMSTLSRGMENGEDRGSVARMAASLGRAAERTGSDTLGALRTGIRYYKFAETVQSRDTTAFLLGVSSLSLAQRLANEARSTRRCEDVKEMQAALVDAQINLVKGGRAFPVDAPPRLRLLQPVTEYSEQLAKALCR
jgi:tetratricopeptide (TPR) repeat protein